MAKWVVGSGLDDYLKQLVTLEKDSTTVIKRSVYEGAGVVAEEFEQQIDAIPSTLISEIQRQGLHDGLGLAKMRDDSGFINTKIGFDGYNEDNRYKTAIRWKANAAVARRICAGTSHQPAYDFVRKAINASKTKAENAMKEQLDQEITKRTK